MTLIPASKINGDPVESRKAVIRSFLKKYGLDEAKREMIAGDASFRKYERIDNEGHTVILMDAPPDKEDIKPFVKIAKFLLKHGFGAPEILAEDPVNGLLLLEDLGDDLYSRVLKHCSANMEEALYHRAVDALVSLHQVPVDLDVPHYSVDLLRKEVELLTDWFLPQIHDKVPDGAKKQFLEIWESLFPHAFQGRNVIVLRDYHADNLLWLPGREGLARVGLLDFQDAVIGPDSYDLVSLLEDARRDVSPKLAKSMLDYYMASLPESSAKAKEAFLTSYRILGAQRNCKIVGIFARLAVRDKKPSYLAFLPRVWSYLEQDLQHPIMAPLKAWLDEYVPYEFRGALEVV